MNVEYVDHMGTDLSVVNAARVSFDRQSEWETRKATTLEDSGVLGSLEYETEEKVLSEKDAKLIRFLAKHDHWTPFGHTAISLRMQAPIPVRTQCFKHKVGLVENEESRRYVFSKPGYFVPELFRMKPEGSTKQGSADVHPMSDWWRDVYVTCLEEAIELYEAMIRDDVCPEQARFILPQGCEVNWVWTGNLMSFANFYKKRSDPHAQREIQDLAHMVGDVIRPLFPVSWEALTK